MERLSSKLFLLITCIAITSAIAAATDNDVTTLSQISGYRHWTRINSEPIKAEVPLTVTLDPSALAKIAL